MDRAVCLYSFVYPFMCEVKSVRMCVGMYASMCYVFPQL